MYNEHYHLSDKPFEICPNVRYLFLNSGYKEILSALVYGVNERKGIIALVGEVGTGKTLMLNAMLERLGENVKYAFISNADLTFKQMLIYALNDLGVAEIGRDYNKSLAIKMMETLALEQYQVGSTVVLIIDEAQNLRTRTMENLRMLSNLETQKHKLIQIVLSGQPELDDKLNRDDWRQLVQRITLKRYATELTREETHQYIDHRLKQAGSNGTRIFEKSALKEIFEQSNGVPRKINIICDNALLIGYGLEKRTIDRDIIKEVAQDLGWWKPENKTSIVDSESESASSDKRRIKWRSTFFFLCALVLAGLLLVLN